MGGFTNPPPPPNEGAGVTAAPDVSPDNAFDFTEIANALMRVGSTAKAPALDARTSQDAQTGSNIDTITFVFTEIGNFLRLLVEQDIKVLEPWLEGVLKFALILLEPVKKLAGSLSGEYVKFFAGEQAGISIGSAGRPRPHMTGTAADAFDSILAPIGINMGGANPAEPGSGHAAAQYVLGSLVNLHLATWVVNVISNMTGIGALHFINSFDEVILAALNTRAFGRMAFKPYINTYISEPTTRDLHLQYPLKDPGPGSLVKSFLRKGLSVAEMQHKLKEKGFSEEVSAQLLLDTMKELSPADVAYLVKHGHMTRAQGIQQLELTGWVTSDAEALLQMEIHKEAEALQRAIAAEVVALIGDRRLDPDAGARILKNFQLTDEEIHLYLARGAIKLEATKNLSLQQVSALFKAGLVDLDYVQEFLRLEGYKARDAQLLILLEFTEAADLRARKEALAAQLRIQEINLKEQADVSVLKHQDALAKAQAKLAAKKAARAARFGG